MIINRPVSQEQLDAKYLREDSNQHGELLKAADNLLLNLAVRLNDLEDKADKEATDRD